MIRNGRANDLLIHKITNYDLNSFESSTVLQEGTHEFYGEPTCMFGKISAYQVTVCVLESRLEHGCVSTVFTMYEFAQAIC